MPTRWERELRRLREAQAPLEAMRERAQRPPRLNAPPRSPRERRLAGIVGVAVFGLVVALVWVAFLRTDDPAPAGGAEPPPVSGPVSLWLSAERVPPGAFDIVAVLVAHDEIDAIFGVHATVDRWDGAAWVPHGEVVVCMDHWHCTAHIVPPGEVEAVPGLGLESRPSMPGPVERFTTAGLDPGWYRLSQTANEGVVARGIFEVVPEAAPPLPLWRIEVPAISISPALLPPEGGEVYLYPLVPPGTDGSQSREEVQRAVEGLSETARIERWNGSEWEPVTTIELLGVSGDDLPRTALVPPLVEGEYRLVRDGPAGPHLASFWVDPSV
jgi:hypothetical protein